MRLNCAVRPRCVSYTTSHLRAPSHARTPSHAPALPPISSVRATLAHPCAPPMSSHTPARPATSLHAPPTLSTVSLRSDAVSLHSDAISRARDGRPLSIARPTAVFMLPSPPAPSRAAPAPRSPVAQRHRSALSLRTLALPPRALALPRPVTRPHPPSPALALPQGAVVWRRSHVPTLPSRCFPSHARHARTHRPHVPQQRHFVVRCAALPSCTLARPRSLLSRAPVPVFALSSRIAPGVVVFAPRCSDSSMNQS
ncbi:hypothetical protein DENSPDRAFT_885180 [Dentipellis sp. KUC8613]|nr:hypothetical protein DENSPDRAFT_885180 [Dentipellis sp. KUC8613]